MNKTKETTKLHTPIFDVVEKEFDHIPNFKPVGLKCPDWVMILAADDDLCENPVCIFVRQTRWGIENKTVEFPCGTVEIGEDPKHAAIREFKEETGIEIDAEDLILMGTTNPNPAMFSNRMHFYMYKNTKLLEYFNSRKSQELDENEDCEVFVSRLNDQIPKLLEHGMGAAALGFYATVKC